MPVDHRWSPARCAAVALVALIAASAGCVSGAERRLSAPERSLGPPVAAEQVGAVGLLHPAEPAITAEAAEPGARRGDREYVAGAWRWDGVRWVWRDGAWEARSPAYVWRR